MRTGDGRDVHTELYHFTLQITRQDRNESLQQFHNSCKSLAQKVVLKSEDPQIQCTHRENVDRILLASSVSGLIVFERRQVGLSHPRSLEQNLKTTITVQ